MSSTTQVTDIDHLICRVDGCERDDIRAFGYCSKHYAYQHRHGHPEPQKREPTPLAINSMDAIWLAAIIDCEGWVGTTASRRSNKTVYTFGIGVGTTTLPLIERCRQITGLGQIAERSPLNPRARQQWHWNVWRIEEVQSILVTIRPYLLIKQKQADLIIDAPPRHSINPSARRALHEALRQLNKRGRD